MALPPLAQVSDLAAWVGQTIESADPRAGAVLSAASALVRSYTGENWVATDEAPLEVPADVAAIVVQVAGRVWLNPDALESFSIDDSTRRWGAGGSAGLHLTAAEKDILGGYRQGGVSTGLGTIGVTRGDISGATGFVPTAPTPAGYPFPWYSADGPW